MEEENDIIIEESTEEGETLSGGQKIKKLQERIKELEKEKQEYLDGWQRARADYANLQKTTDEDKKRVRRLVEEDFIYKLIPVVDSFLMAMSNKESWESVDPAWRSGVEYIYGQLMNTLESHDLKLFGEIGDKFDPAKYEGVSEEITDDEEKDHTISKVHQKGFLLGDSILRPARVSVYTLEKE
ncbi:MAG: nucleotide exchange factor GrpE [Patescibacteria group bacterium]